MGGQKSLRTYWRNYFEKTDTLIWVVDSTDRDRLGDCQRELAELLVVEVNSSHEKRLMIGADVNVQRLMGASLLVLKNKSDIGGAMDEEQVRKVCESLGMTC